MSIEGMEGSVPFSLFLLFNRSLYAVPCPVYVVHVFHIRFTSQIEKLDFFRQFNDEFAFLGCVQVKAS